MVNHWRQNEAGQRPQGLAPLSSSSSKRIKTTSQRPPAAVPFSFYLSPLWRSHLLLCLLSFLAITIYALAADQQQQRPQHKQQQLQQQQEADTMSPALPEGDAVPSDESTADSLTEPAARAPRIPARAATETPRKP